MKNHAPRQDNSNLREDQKKAARETTDRAAGQMEPARNDETLRTRSVGPGGPDLESMNKWGNEQTRRTHGQRMAQAREAEQSVEHPRTPIQQRVEQNAAQQRETPHERTAIRERIEQSVNQRDAPALEQTVTNETKIER